MECGKLYKLLLIALSCTVISAMSSKTKSNQLWWNNQRYERPLQIGCRAMCCNGRDSHCYAQGPKIGGAVAANGRCFCDEGCLDMGDCCEDYSVECEAVDCVVGEWQDYGSCSKPCGLGAKSRSRKVIQEPRNGGTECPALKESTVCVGTKCYSRRHLGRRGRVDRETARIMPALYGQYRNYKQYNANMDIRKNLYDRYYAPLTAVRRGYCAMYEIKASRKNCFTGGTQWAKVLTKGASVCVECQSKAMDGSFGATTCVGHGNTEKDTFWTAVNVHGCHGWWRRTNELSECSCNSNQGMDFIFV